MAQKLKCTCGRSLTPSGLRRHLNGFYHWPDRYGPTCNGGYTAEELDKLVDDITKGIKPSQQRSRPNGFVPRFVPAGPKRLTQDLTGSKVSGFPCNVSPVFVVCLAGSKV